MFTSSSILPFGRFLAQTSHHIACSHAHESRMARGFAVGFWMTTKQWPIQRVADQGPKDGGSCQLASSGASQEWRPRERWADPRARPPILRLHSLVAERARPGLFNCQVPHFNQSTAFYDSSKTNFTSKLADSLQHFGYQLR